MKFQPLPLEGAYCLELEPIEDERGSFSRTFCRQELVDHGLDPHIEQCSLSFNKLSKTLRGMHFQKSPNEETKIVSCIQGAIYDVIVDLRPSSQTFLKWYAVEMSAENNKALYVPKGFAHGFQTLTANAKVYYQISHRYAPESSGGIRWDDPILSIEWPYTEGLIISQKDRSYLGIACLANNTIK